MASASERAPEGEPLGIAPADIGRYQVFATLGRGGMADVYLAVARGPMGFNKLVVLKRLRAHLAEESSFREMFLDEARLAARLNHPNVIQSYEVGETDGSYFIAMEYLDGQPLNRIVAELKKRGENVDHGMAARIVADACSGLAHAHELRDYDGTPLKIIHRDVSPHNVFVTYEGQVKLVDFGIAKAAVSRSETEIGVLKGKVAYMAPEQAMGAAIDGRADVFAMGVVLWEIVTGRALFAGENAANTLHRLMNEPIPTPSSVAPVEPGLEAIVMRALDKDVQRRFQSARDLRDALESWMRDTGRAVRPEDVGAWLGAIFADRRGRMQREIQRYMAEATRPHTGTTQSFSRAQVMSLASIEQMERAGGNPLEKLANLSSDSGASLVSSSMAGSQVGASIPSAIDASKRNRRVAAVAIAIAAVLAFGIALLVIAPWKKGPPPAPVTASTDTASAPTASPPATPAPPATPTPPATGAALASASATASPSASAPAPASPPPRYASTPAPPPRRPGPAPSRPSTPSAPPVAPDASPGFLTLDTYPWTRVTENGRVLGSTPLVHVQLSAGTHALMLDNPDQQIHQAYTVTIKSGETVSRRLGLR